MRLMNPVRTMIKAKRDLLRAGLARTHTERFLFATRLYKIQKTLDKAKIIYKLDMLNKAEEEADQ